MHDISVSSSSHYIGVSIPGRISDSHLDYRFGFGIVSGDGKVSGCRGPWLRGRSQVRVAGPNADGKKRSLTDGKKRSLTDWELREIYRRSAIRSGIDRQFAEDVASEMYAMALYTECRRGISRFNCSAHWLRRDALRKLNCKDELPKDLLAYDAFIQGISQESMAELMRMYEFPRTRGYGSNAKNRDSLMARELKRYRLLVNGSECRMNAEEIVEALNKSHCNISPSQIVHNLKSRGKRLWLAEGKLWETITEFSKSVGVSTKTAKLRYVITAVKIRVAED